MGLIRVDVQKCQQCNACIIACPIPYTNTIEIVNGKRCVSVNPERCNCCGECISACPYNARSFDEKLLKNHLAQNSYENSKKAITENDKYTRTILESISEAVVVTNENRIVEYVNKQAEKILGYPHDIYIGKDLFDFMVRINLDDLVDGSVLEYKGIHQDGTYVNLRTTCRVIMFNSEKKFVLVMENITKEKEVENLKQNFVSIISHELRTPLTSIRGAIGLISSGMMGELPEKINNLLKIAENNSLRLINIINDMLDLEKIKAGKMDFYIAEHDVQTLINEAIELNRDYASQHEVSIANGLVLENARINVDKNKFIQIITNLLSNASKFSPKGEEIVIDVERKSNIISISVINRGEGISKGAGSKIFDSFIQIHNTTNQKKKGTGLGLNICKYLTEQMRGAISYLSVPNEKTTFTVEFPEIYTLSTQKTVLIGEDNLTTARILKRKFEHLGYRGDIATTAKEVEDKLAQYKYDLLSLDLGFPDKNGLEVLSEIRFNLETKDLPVIIISASKEDFNVVKNYNIVEWCEKTFDENKLQDVIEKLNKEKNINKCRILHVEDDIELTKVISSTFEQFATIEVAETLKKAENILTREEYDLIILDYKLPDGTCDELIPIIKKYNSNASIVIFSAYSIEQELKNEVDAVVLKTEISNEEFLEKVKTLVK